MSELHDVPLALLRRGGQVESLHRGRYVVCDSDGAVLESGGDAGEMTWVRSSAKPFQALPIAASGAADSLGLTGEELAIACGSHGGEEAHVAAARSILAKAGLSEEDLESGAHPPLHRPAAEALALAGETPGAVHGNCSGKHAGMLALCVHRGYETEGYRDRDHPVQREILSAVSAMCGLDDTEVSLGGDGCGAPAFTMPLRSLATGFARLGAGNVPAQLAEAASRLRKAMREHPFMVAGTGMLDTRLMSVSQVVCKSGAEGVFAAGLQEGVGVAIKVSDGSARAVEPAALSLLEHLGVSPLPESETSVPDLHGEVVGSLTGLL